MRFAAIADVHGNSDALEAVLADIDSQGIRDVVNLGDHVSGPWEAARTADMLMARNFPSIRGDQDRRLVELAAEGTSKRGDLQQLSQSHIDWLAAMPASLTIADDVFLCHGTPEDDATYWLETVSADGHVVPSPLQFIESKATVISASLILTAHSHMPRLVRLSDGRTVANPGSVGLPAYEHTKPRLHVMETGAPHANYGIFERRAAGWHAAFHWVPYDSRRLAGMARAKGLPAWASAVETGRVR